MALRRRASELRVSRIFLKPAVVGTMLVEVEEVVDVSVVVEVTVASFVIVSTSNRVVVV